MKFCEKLQKLRKERHMSQEELADKLEVSRQAVSKWESGTTYPEMDKLLTLCKLFNITLDSLTNDEISLEEIKKENKENSITKELYYLIDKTFIMFKNMNSKEITKCLFELLILFIILLLFKIPFNYLYDLGSNVIYTIPKGSNFIDGMWSFFINLIYLILFVLTYIYIYKTYYLDKYKIKTENANNIKTETTKEEKRENEKNTEDEKDNFSNNLFKTLSKIFSFLIKLFTGFISLPFIINFILLIIIECILIIYLFKGITYFGLIIILGGSISINIILLLLFFSFIFNTHINFKKIIGIFITSLGTIGIGTGIFGYELANTEFINSDPVTNFEKITYSKEYTNNIILHSLNYFYINENSYQIDESLGDKVIIETTYYNELMYFELNSYSEGNYENIYVNRNIKNSKKILDLAINDLKNKKIYNYDKLFNVDVKIKSSSSSINKIKENYSNYLKENNCNIDNSYDNEINNLEEKNSNLESEINDLKEENENLKTTIKDLKDNIKNLLN